MHRDSADDGGNGAILASDYQGVDFLNDKRTASKYRARIRYEGKTRYVGCYKLASDAALACDKALEFFKVSNAKPNFATEQDHEKARAAELTRTGLEADLCAV